MNMIEKVNGIYYLKSALLSWAIWWATLILGLIGFVLSWNDNIASPVMVPLIIGTMIFTIYMMFVDYKKSKLPKRI